MFPPSLPHVTQGAGRGPAAPPEGLPEGAARAAAPGGQIGALYPNAGCYLPPFKL